MSGPWIAVVVVLWVVVVVLGVVVLGLLRRVGDVLAAVEARLQQPVASVSNGLPVGARVPRFEAVTESGETVSSGRLGVGGVYVLLRSGCGPCDGLVGELAGLADPLAGVRLVLVGDDTVEQRDRLAGVDAVRVYQREGQVSRAFACTAVPYAFAVDGDGDGDGGVVVAAGAADRLSQLRALADSLTTVTAAVPVRPSAATGAAAGVADGSPV